MDLVLLWIFIHGCHVCSFHADDMNGELLARFCGQTAPTIPIVVFTPGLWVHFRSDEFEVDLGFKVTYHFSGNIDH